MLLPTIAVGATAERRLGSMLAVLLAGAERRVVMVWVVGGVAGIGDVLADETESW